MVTGVDLVHEQLRVAAGHELGYDQSAIKMRGHSIEVRINAEDVPAGFLPSTGTVHNLRLPGGPWVRIDSCLFRGLVVGLNYDPMLAKIIVWGPDRNVAIARMKRALEELNVGGVRTSAPAAMAVLEEPRFIAGDFDTKFLESLDLSKARGGLSILAAAAAALHRRNEAQRQALAPDASSRRGWTQRHRGSLTDHIRRSQ
jgi:acetyl-CoA carboxylase biotin carboxylase subunit